MWFLSINFKSLKRILRKEWSDLTYSIGGFDDFVTGFQKITLKVIFPTKNGLFLAIFACRGIIVLLSCKTLIFCAQIADISFIFNIPPVDLSFWNFGANEVARMSFINAGGRKEALFSLIQSLLKALIHSNLPLRRS